MLNKPYYKDNPGLTLRVVKTVWEELEYECNCVCMPDGYYVKGVDVQLVNDQWKLPETVIDHSTGQNVKITRELRRGIVAVNDKGIETNGYFTANPFKKCTVLIDGCVKVCMDYTLLDPKFYLENISTGWYYKTVKLNDAQKKNLGVKALHNFGEQPYNSDDNPKLFNKAIEIYGRSVFPIDKDLKYASRYLDGLTFGVELEAINGNLPSHILHKYGIIICKDGSVNDGNGVYPPEYVTVPLSGAKGLQTLREAPKEIAKRSDFNIKCSYHLHIGGFPITRAFLVSMYALCYKIQQDVFKMFPGYKLNPDGIKKQNYCMLLPNILNSFGSKDFNKYINDSFMDMYRFISGGQSLGIDYNRKNKNNPWYRGGGGHKWNIKTRYYWVNFVNCVFGNRNTIEFRVHTPTFNSDKIINWLFMCAAIIRFAQNNTARCLSNDPVSFVEVLNFYKALGNGGSKLSERLVAYYNERVAYFKIDAERGDRISEAELLEDANYEFNITKFETSI